jgi:hypothetical protein
VTTRAVFGTAYEEGYEAGMKAAHAACMAGVQVARVWVLKEPPSRHRALVLEVIDSILESFKDAAP